MRRPASRTGSNREGATKKKRRPTPRDLQPRLTDGLALRPILVSDLSAPAACGLESRAFRAFVRSRSIPHTLEGRRLLVLASDLEAALRERQADEAGERADDDDRDDGAPEPSRAEILRRVAGGR